MAQATIDNTIQNKTGASEFKLTLVSFLYFFFVICSYYVLKPLRDGLAMEFGATNINYLNILSMFSLLVVNAVYSLIVGKYKREIFIPAITSFFLVSILFFWSIFTYVRPIQEMQEAQKKKKAEVVETVNKAAANTPGIASATMKAVAEASEAVSPKTANESKPEEATDWTKVIYITLYYLFVNMFSLVVVSMFWSFINDVFTVDQGKRLYVYIGYGGLVGGIAGSELTKYLTSIFNAQNISISYLLFVSIALLAPTIWCMKYIHNNYHKEEAHSDAKQAEKPKQAKASDGFFAVVRNTLLIMMALEMFLYTCSTTLFSQQINTVVGEEITDVAGRTAFWADLYSKVNIASLIAQFFITKLVMMLPSPVLGLLLLNIIQVIGNLLLITLPAGTLGMQIGGMSATLMIISWTYILRRCLDYSTARVLRESVYIPMDKESKYQGKGFIDTVIFRFGDGISSATLIGGMSWFGYGKWIDYSILLTMIIQFYVIIKAARMYTNLVKQTEGTTIEAAPATKADAETASDSNN